MPVLLRYKGYKFFFFANEGEPPEPIHVHIRKGSTRAKIWLQPELKAACSTGVPAQELRELVRIAGRHRDLLIKKWEDFFDASDD